jgi:hypothetical protein
MPQELSRSEERRGTRRLMVGAAAIAGILLIAVVAWPLMSENR